MLSMMAASVEDLPEPVGPVARTMLFCKCTISSRRAGRLRSSKLGILSGMTRMTMAQLPRWRKMLTRKRNAGEAVGKIGGADLIELAEGMLVFAHDVVGDG